MGDDKRNGFKRRKGRVGLADVVADIHPRASGGPACSVGVALAQGPGTERAALVKRREVETVAITDGKELDRSQGAALCGYIQRSMAGALSVRAKGGVNNGVYASAVSRVSESRLRLGAAAAKPTTSRRERHRIVSWPHSLAELPWGGLRRLAKAVRCLANDLALIAIALPAEAWRRAASV